jgi:hypothetical protein
LPPELTAAAAVISTSSAAGAQHGLRAERRSSLDEFTQLGRRLRGDLLTRANGFAHKLVGTGLDLSASPSDVRIAVALPLGE